MFLYYLFESIWRGFIWIFASWKVDTEGVGVKYAKKKDWPLVALPECPQNQIEGSKEVYFLFTALYWYLWARKSANSANQKQASKGQLFKWPVFVFRVFRKKQRRGPVLPDAAIYRKK